ncbi:MAG: T9SS type A sorting domain-containing protein [Flavobacteriales bacterium]|nr:T9SS type A sorting domain-containing protein [Flavobacteriales bacterium]
MVNTTRGWSVGAAGTILSTTNGSAWSSETSGTSDGLFGVHFSDASNGWAVGENGTILYRYEFVDVDKPAQRESEFNVQVYPNPNKGAFSFEFDTPEPADLVVTVSNALGQVVFEEIKARFTGQYRKELDLNGSGKGIYQLRISSDSKVVTRQIIIE